MERAHMRYLEIQNEKLNEYINILKYRERFWIIVTGMLTVMFTVVCVCWGLS